MACNRCEDIHNAQSSGLTTKGCECQCHESIIYYPPNYLPYYPPYQPYPVVYTGETFGIDTGTTITSCKDGKCSTLNLNI